MSKSITPTFAIHLYDGTVQAFAWDCKHDGRPTDIALEAYIMRYIDSLKIGGTNEHVSKALGYMPVPNRGRIIRQSTKQTVAQWQAPALMAI